MMKINGIYLGGAALVVVVVAVVGNILAMSGDMNQVVLSPITNQSPDQIVRPTSDDWRPQIVGSIPFWDQERAVLSFADNREQLDYISLFWYYLDREGNVRTYQDRFIDLSIVSQAQQAGVKVFALVANMPGEAGGGDWDWRRVDSVIETKAAREKHIMDLLKLVQKGGFDGVNIDYEAMREGQRDEFSEFIKELAQVFHEKNKLVSVAVYAKTADYEGRGSPGNAQDISRLGNFADHLYVMTYDEHRDESDPGPIGSLEWMRKVLAYMTTTARIPAKKIFLGLPLYGYDWQIDRPGSTARGFEYDYVSELIQKTTAEVVWDQAAGESHFHYDTGSGLHEVWFNDARSVAAKMELAREFQLGGVHFWRLGREDPAMWQVLEGYLRP